MKKISLVSLFAALLLVIQSGCISYEYSGDKGTPNEGRVQLFNDSSRITRKYTVLGQAKISGNYQDVSYKRMIDKLKEKAAECGADAILIVEQQVLESGESSGRSSFMTAYDYDDTNQSWSQLYRDVDQNFTNTMRKQKQVSNGSINNMRRIIRAEFLKYKDAAKKAAK